MKLLLICLVVHFFCLSLNAQNVGIGILTPDASAALEISGTDKGVLVPRIALVNTSLSSPVVNPANGLLIYNTTSNASLTQGFYFWSGIGWEQLITANTGAVPKGGIIEMETKASPVPKGYTYIGYSLETYSQSIGQTVGSWAAISTKPGTEHIRNPSVAFYNNRIFTWSGRDQSYASYSQAGHIYNVAGNSWTSMTTTSAPVGRYGNVAVTDNSNGYMMIWGGITGYINAGVLPVVTATGGIYDLIYNNWLTMAASPLVARMKQTGVWTGTSMLIWGGSDASGTPFADGSVYTRSTNSWSAMATSPLAARYGHSALWTGSRMIIWGGTNGSVIFNDGASYNPATNSWTSIATNNVFYPTHSHSVTWTGTDMYVFGGENAYGITAIGMRYNVAANTWYITPSCPGAGIQSAAFVNHAAVWTGTELVIIGGENSVNTISGTDLVRAYNPSTNSWRLYHKLPSSKTGALAVWTGTKLIVQGGSYSSSSGYEFDPNTGAPQDVEVQNSQTFYKYRKD